MNLVIVESPAKSKTIEKYLGKDYKVVSSVGHIRDLSTKGKYGLGVDIEHDFKPTYEPMPNKKKVIRENDKLNISDIIIIDYSNISTKENEDYYLELSPIFGESEYDIYNSYADHIETFGVENPERTYELPALNYDTLEKYYPGIKEPLTELSNVVLFDSLALNSLPVES